MKLSREIKTGIIAVSGILLLILGYTYLKSSPLFSSSKIFYAEFSNIGGLKPGTLLSMNGLDVGKVSDITFKDNKGSLVVKLIFTGDIEFSRSSKIQLYSANPLGGKSIQIVQVFDDAPLAKSGDTLPSDIYGGLFDQIEPSLVEVRGAFSAADSTLTNLNSLLDASTRIHIQQSAANFDAGMQDFRRAAATMNQLLQSNADELSASIASVKGITANLEQLTDSLNQAGLAQTASDLKLTVERLNNLLAGIEKGEGTLGKFATDDELYMNLNQASRELDLLLQDFRLNPKRYVNVSVFGKKQKEYVFPENDPAAYKAPEEN